MRWQVRAKIKKEVEGGTLVSVFIPGEYIHMETQKFSMDGIFTGELRLDDGREILADQRKKAYATIKDIAKWQQDYPEIVKELMKYEYIAATGEEYFSLSNCSVTTARKFISFILDFALLWGVPLTETLLDRADDIEAAIYSSLIRKKCVICGLDGEIHHWDALGMGADRRTADDSDKRKICLCRGHHTEVHQIGRNEFEKKYYVYGVIFNGGSYGAFEQDI